MSILTNSNSIWFTENLIEGILSLTISGKAVDVANTEYVFRQFILIGFVFLAVFYLVKLIKFFKHELNIDRKKQSIGLVLQLVIYMAFIYFFPAFSGIPFSNLFQFQPDIALVTIVSILLSLLYALLTATINRTM